MLKPKKEIMSNTFYEQSSVPTVGATVSAITSTSTEAIEKQPSLSMDLNEISNGGGGGAIGNSRREPATIQACRYFLHGICRRGARCRFSHDTIGGGGEDLAISGSNRGNQQQQQQINEVLISAVSSTEISTGTSSTTSTSSPSSSTSTTTQTSFSQSEEENLASKLAKWAEAPAFVPKNPKMISSPIDIETEALSTAYKELHTNNNSRPRTWAEVVSGAESTTTITTTTTAILVDGIGNIENFEISNTINSLCPYKCPCPYGPDCIYTLHWELCKMCDKYCLHPKDLEQRRKHNKECVQRHEQAMEFSFAIARSRDKVCGICLDIIMELPHNFRRFGILSHCNHVFCLACIRKWRQAQDFNHNVTRSCPQCRVYSEFVCPSSYWVETKEQKDKLINDYRATLGRKHCKYFKFGKGKCPFGNKCFYKHALPDGEVVNVGGPNRAVRKLTQANRHDVRTVNLVDFCLWDFVEHRDMLSCNNLESDHFYYDSD